MSDLIDRQAAIDALNSRKTAEQCEAGKTRNWTVDICVDMIKQLSPIQLKKGKWIKTARWGRVYYCNQCRNYLDFDGVNAGRGSTNFCPNCGAKMEAADGND